MEDGSGYDGGGVPGLWLSTVRVSAEPVRSPAVPSLELAASGLVDALGAEHVTGGAVALRQVDHLVATGEGADLSRLTLEDFVEVMEYDPVRHVALVVGARDAPRATPLLWLLLRVFPGAAGAAVLPARVAGDAGVVGRAPRGSFDEALAVAEAVKGRGRESVIGPAAASYERVGTVLVMPPGDDAAASLGAALGLLDR